MKPGRPTCSAGGGLTWLIVVLRAGVVAGGEPDVDFDLRATCPRVVDVAEAPAAFEAGIVLESRLANPQVSDGAQAWSLAIRTVGGLVVSATTEGTVAAPAPEGLLEDGFVETQLTTGPGNEGVISAVVLSFVEPVTLPPRGEELLLRLTVEVSPLPRDCEVISVLFADGLRGGGRAVDNRITYHEETFKDDGGPRDPDVDREEPCFVTVCRAARFVRGNCNGDGQLDLSDPVSALNDLFRGMGETTCRKACDVNDDGSVNLTDPIQILQHLFRSGPPPAAPFPACGVDPTPDGLSCRVSCAPGR